MGHGQQDQAVATLLREYQSLGKKTCVFETMIQGVIPKFNWNEKLGYPRCAAMLHACLCSDESRFSNPLHSSCTKARISGNVLWV